VLVSGADTDGRFALVETYIRPGDDLPLHAHTREDEVLYVLRGQVTIWMGDEPRACPAGTCLLLPRGHEHACQVEADEARLLTLLLPAGLEGLYRELAGGVDLRGATPGQGARDFEWLVTAAAHYGVEITGPCPDHERGEDEPVG
jgi:hypothetical protein